MKKLILPLLLLCNAALIQAQVSQNLPTAGKSQMIYRESNGAERVACANDELDYAIAKNIGPSVRLIGLQANQTNAIAAGSQYFPASQPVTVSGLWVLGRKVAAGTISLKASIYAATADSLPGAELGSGTISYSTTSTGAIGYVQINFASPVTVSQPYIVAVENLTATPAFQICTNYFTNNGDTASGRNEGLPRAKFSGNWLNPMALFTGFNADFVISPKVSYSNTANFTLSSTTACVNTPVALTNTSSPLYSSRFYNVNAFLNHFFSVPDSTFLWTLPSGQQYSTNASVNSATGGVVNAKLKATLVPWQNVPSCVDSITKTVTYNAVDNAAFTYSSNTICAGSPNITPTTTSAGTFTSTPAGLVFANAATGEIDVAASDEGAYSLTFNTSGACPATSTQTVTITSSPDASFSYANTTYCLGSANPSPVLGTGASAGTYSSTAGLVINASTGVIDLAASSAGSYTVTNTIAASGACPASSETFSVTINAQPTATISGGGSICAGSGNSVPVSVALTGTGPWSIVVSNGATNQTIPVTTSPATIPVSEALAGTYTIVSVSNALCSNTGTGTAVVTVAPIPTVSAITNQNVCNGAPSNVILFSGPVTGTTFAWTNSNAASGLAASGNGNILSFTAVNTTGAPVTATITVTPTANGCVGTPNTFTYTINPGPAVTYTAPGTVCVYNNAITLTPGTPAGGTFSGTGVTGSSFNPATAGLGTHTITYSITAGGCIGTATASIVVSACASIEDIIANDGLAIYPNPSTGNVTFAFSNTEVNDVNLSIVSTEGKTVYQNNFQTTKATIDLSTLARGTYFVRVTMNGKLSTSKLILE
jgi:hypothetical protein